MSCTDSARLMGTSPQTVQGLAIHWYKSPTAKFRALLVGCGVRAKEPFEIWVKRLVRNKELQRRSSAEAPEPEFVKTRHL